MDTPKTAGIKRPALNFKFPLNLNFLATMIMNFIASPQNIIGLDIGFSYIKILKLQKKGKGYIVQNYITRALPQMAKDMYDEKRKLVGEFVKEFVAEGHIKKNLGRVAVSGRGVYIFSLTLPVLNKKDLRGAVGIELKKRLPFQTDIAAINYDYFVTDQLKDDKGTQLQVTCIAADQQAIEELVQLLKEIKVVPVGLYAIPDSLGNLVAFCFDEHHPKPVALLDFGANTSMLNFYRGRSLLFSREIPIGGDHLTHAMAKAVETPVGTITFSIEEAEKLKRNCGVPLEDEAKVEYLTDNGPLRGEQIAALLRPTLERLVMEINRTLSYFTKTFKADAIEELFLTGGSSRLKNLDRFLLFNLEGIQKVEPLNLLKKIKGWADQGVLKQELMMEQAIPHLAVAFGLCLGSGGKVNLLPASEKLEQKTLILNTALRIVFPLIVLINLAMYALNYGNALKYKILNNNLDFEINRLEVPAAQVKEYLNMKSKFEQRKDLLEKAQGRQPFWWGMFKEISNITPREVVLEKIATVTTKNPKEIRIFGRVVSKFTVVDMALSQYMMALEESPYFSRVELVSSKADMYSPVPAAEFEIVCQLKY